MDQYITFISEWLGVVAVLMIAGVSARLKPRPLIFKYPRREAVISAVLYILILGFSFIYYSLGGRALEMDNQEQVPLLLQRLVLVVLCLLPFGVAIGVRKQPLLSVGWHKAMLGPAFRLGLTLIFLSIFLRGKIFNLIHGVSSAQGMALLLWLAICLVEETVFRGYIQPRLSGFLGKLPGLLVTVLLFAVWQIPRLMYTAPQSLPVGIAFVLLQGLVLGWVMQKSGHVLASTLYRTISEWLTLI